MRCLFCREDSSNSRSIEHIVPESLGNKSHVLPPTVVCDRCNNYFARKVEKPFLESTAILRLRFDQELQSKRGIIPPAQAVLLPNFPALIQRYSKGPIAASVWMSPEAIASLCKQTNGALIFPAEAPLPTGPLVSRFLAKMGLEAMAIRLVSFPEGLDYLAGEQQLDLVRHHARFGDPSEWPIHTRRIYEAQQKWLDTTGQANQVLFEFDILNTEASEWYFVLALFGLEFVINLGGPEISGYITGSAIMAK